MHPPSARFYRFGPFLLDREESTLAREGQIVPLTLKAFEILSILVANGGRLVTKKELMSAVWADAWVEEANLTVNISLLRKALGDSGSYRPYIETMPKRGYRFMAKVTAFDRVDAAPGPGTASAAEGVSAAFRSTAARIALGLAVVAAVGASIWLIASRVVNGTRTAHASVRSLAVLPFRSLNTNAADEYLGLGIADALITRLGTLHRIAVRPTSAVRKFRSRDEDSLSAGRKLKVDAVLEGSIQRLGPRVRVTASMLMVPDGASLWSGTFERGFTDMFALEDSISHELATALALKLSEEETRNFGKRSTQNPEAYQLYLKGRYFWNRRSTDGVTRARECFEQAIRIDPKYALAWGGLADSFLLLGSYGYSRMPPRDAMPQAETAAETALAIDDSLAEVHASLGYARLVYDWKWPAAQEQLQRAIELNPQYTTAHHWYSHYLVSAGRLPESLAASRRALAIDPVDLALNEHLGWHYLMARQYDDAIRQCQKTLEMDQGFIQARRVLGLAWLYRGDATRAVTEFQALALANQDPVVQALLARAYAAAGRAAEAKAIVARLGALSKERYVSSADLAAIHTALGDPEQALEWLERAYGERSNSMIYLRADPGWDPLRRDPRFEKLVRRIGLP